MRFLKVIFLVLGVFLLANSCGTNANDKAKSGDWSLQAAKIYHKKPKINPDKMENYKQGVNEFYEKTLLRSGFNGGIVVAKYGEVIFEKYHGYFDLRTKDTLTKNSAFHIASVSKTFTAMGVLKLVEKGKLALDDSLQKFFPDFPYEGVTVKSLLTHRSGLPNYAYFLEVPRSTDSAYYSNQDILNFLIHEQPPKTANPNTRFQYCNTNFAMLALIIEQVAGIPYREYMKRTFFDPLQMKDTYVFDIAHHGNTAMPSFNYKGQLEPYTPLDAIYGDKNIFSTPEDLLKWDQALYDTSFFSNILISEAYTPYSNEHPGVRNYGLGWRMNVYPDGKKLIYHNGWWHGNNAAFIRDIQDSVTIIVLGNRFDKSIYRAKDLLGVFESGRILDDGD